MAPPRIEEDQHGIDCSVYVQAGLVVLLVTYPGSDVPINAMVLPPADATALARELIANAAIADRQQALHREGFATTADAPEVLVKPQCGCTSAAQHRAHGGTPQSRLIGGMP